jgi:NTP pyrophosphatase (non-canonical NTP hydrolase)
MTSIINPSHITTAADILTRTCHEAALASGWWTDENGNLKPYNTAEQLMLIVSEISEAMEGDRKGAMDQHLPHRSALEVEIADAIIRAFNLAGRKGLDLGGAISEKLQYNAQRADHKPANRAKPGGKKF